MEITRRDVLRLGAAAIAGGTVQPALGLLGARAAEAQPPKRGGVFRIRGEDPISGLDPHLVVNHHRTNTNLSFTHSRLVRIKSINAVSAWEPYVKNFAPNIDHDYGGRLMVAWLDK